jgi:transposase
MSKRRREGVLNMVKVREILRLVRDGLNQSEIAAAVGASRAAVQDYMRRAEAREIGYEEAKALSDDELLSKLGKKRPGRRETEVLFEPNFARLDQELERKGVTLALLWQEWSREHPGSHYSYATFCRRFNRYRRVTRVTLRQQHRPGEKLFVDYAGLTVSIVDRTTGEIRQCPVFVAVLGASYYKYAEVTHSAELACWLGSHERAFEFFGGVSETVVIDNLKTGVHAAHTYDPVLNRTYQEFAEHYGIAVLPARSRKPRDKAKVEKAVQDIERAVLAVLRDRVFHSVAEANDAIAPLLAALNDRPLRDYGESSKRRFERFEREVLKPLPRHRYSFAQWKPAKVSLDYHVSVDKRHYSVPYQLVGQEVWVRLSEKTVEILHNNERVALHVRSTSALYSHVTDAAHMPPNHVAVISRTAAYFRRWAKAIGPETARQVERILQSRPREEFGYRTIQGIKRLADKKGAAALEKACRQANEQRLVGYRAIARVLAIHESVTTEGDSEQTAPTHKNIRGPGYFH